VLKEIDRMQSCFTANVAKQRNRKVGV
jgi:hypothetical protein